MADIVDQQTRSRMMSGIRGKNTKPELALRRTLHARGFRFRLHSCKIHNRPDLVLPKHRAVVFVHGCFWHRHEGCRYTTVPANPAGVLAGEVRRERRSRQRRSHKTPRRRVARGDSMGVRPAETGSDSATTNRLAAWLFVGPVSMEIGESDILQSGIVATE